MNRMQLPKRPAKRPRRYVRREAPAQVELTLELPRGPKPSADNAPSEDGERERESERGIAIVDFYI